MRARRWGGGAAVLAVCAAGCALFTSLDDLGGDASTDASPNDVQSEGVSDANASDSALDADGGSDATLDAPSSTCPVVDAGTVFCDDFDDSDASGAFLHWSKVQVSAGGTAMRALSDASAPFCIELSLPLNDGGPQGEVGRVFLAKPMTEMTYTFRVRVVRYPSANLPFNLSPIEFAGTAAAGATDFLALRSNSATFTEQFPTDAGGFFTTAHTLTTSIPLGTWVAVRIAWSLVDGGAMTAQVFFDGAPVSIAIPLDPRTAFGFPFLIAGVSFEDPQADGVVVDVDDVVYSFD